MTSVVQQKGNADALRALHGPKIHGPARPLGMRARPVLSLKC